MTRTIKDMPISEKITSSPYELEDIRQRLSGIFENKIDINSSQLAVLELILCLANEIHDLKTNNHATNKHN